MKNKSLRKLLLLFVGLLVLLACEIPGLATPASTIPESIPIESIIAGTAAAAQTKTSLVEPSATQTFTDTPRPTLVPTETATPTETIFFIIPTATNPFKAHSAGSACELVGLEPFDPRVAPGTSVNIKWTMENTSSNIWIESNVDFKHTGGTDMHKIDLFDLPKSIGPGGTLSMTVSMIAPNNSGTYTSTWSVRDSKNTYCEVSANIIVK
ncbi:MAG: NBR1-Ig-like domain-containing protein [Anaerolineae bacterium]|nr:NBR1-Ig-like domain-containing protein [Anaerolineae bacterium]